MISRSPDLEEVSRIPSTDDNRTLPERIPTANTRARSAQDNVTRGFLRREFPFGFTISDNYLDLTRRRPEST